MEYSRESIDRQKKIQDLKNAGVIPYANNYRWKVDISEIRKTEESIKDVDFLMENWAVWEFKTAWRLMSSRWMWKLLFWKIIDSTSEIQVCFMKDKLVFNTGKNLVTEIEIDWESKSAYKIAEKFINVWDYVWVIWDLFITKHWELTIFVKEFQILSKAVRPLPEKWHWVTDQETIYRQRYLDMIMNDESYQRLKLRSKYIKVLRDFYHQNYFTEVETPVLGNSASWAAAKPFITHHNDFDQEFYLRISPETFLKRTTVWRFERVVEFARDFRNEWSDPSHMQEFTMIEHYASWWNFEDNMKYVEKMFDYIFENMPELKKEIEVKDKMWNPRMVNFQTPWQRIDYIEWVKKVCWIDVSKYFIWDEEKLISDIKKAWVEFEWMNQMLVPTLIDYLFKKVLRPSIVWPAFVYNYPKTMQPLARQNDEHPEIVEQFQVIVNGWEIIKAYSELVDPAIQKANFEDQSKAIEKWDEEATTPDDDFVFAMEYWMPCQSGLWMWIERSFSILTGQDNLRDVVLFPLMKTEKKNVSKKEAEAIYRSKKVVVIADDSLPAWMVANAIGQLWVSIWWHSNQKLFEANVLHDKEWNIHYTDCFYWMSNLAWNQEQMAEFVKKCYDANIQVFDFSDIMRKAHTDDDMQKWYKEKSTKDIWYIAVWALINADFEKEFLNGLRKFGE